MKRKALIVQGGWDGHEPKQVSEVFASVLEKEDFEVEVSDTLDAFSDLDKLMTLHLIVPVWTMGTITPEQRKPVCEAVGAGVGLAGCHGGMCDSFRQDTEWQFMTGSQWISHPGGDGVNYKVSMKVGSSPITYGIKDFDVSSEQYYIHIDPACEVLATTKYPVVDYYHSSNGDVHVPVVYTKRWGHGRVFYNSLGHHADIFDAYEPRELMRRGFLWAAEGRDIAIRDGLSGDDFKSTAKMY